MDKPAAEIGVIALRIVEGSGPWGFYLGAAAVVLTLIVIVFARTAGLFDSVRSEKQKTDFLDRVMTQYDRLMAVEADLRKDIDRIEAENDSLRNRCSEMIATTDLLRAQIRRLIELLSAVKDGRMEPSQLPAELAEALR